MEEREPLSSRVRSSLGLSGHGRWRREIDRLAGFRLGWVLGSFLS